jgi:predicted ATPase
MSGMLRLSFLGPFQAILDGEPLTDFKTSKARALLAYLAVTQKTHSRHALAGLLWSDDSEGKAKNSLRVALANLTRLLPDHLEATRLTVGLRPDSASWLDVDLFRKKTQSLSSAQPDAVVLREAVELYRGDFLADLALNGADGFQDWLESERAQLRQRALTAFELVANDLIADQVYSDALPILQRLLEMDPGNEEGHRALMATHGRLGEYDAAIAQYEKCQQQLEQLLGVKPMPETTALFERIRDARAGLVHAAPGDSERFVGRTVELAQLDNLLRTRECRLITILGLGGVGKTRLAVAAARQISAQSTLLFLNGVLFVPLVGVESADVLPTVLAEALHITLAGGGSVRNQLLDYLRNKELLIVLDNFEHLVDGVDLIRDMLASCPDVKILVTSREPLYLESEWRLDLEGLPHPIADAPLQMDQVARYEAVQFLRETARNMVPDFELSANNVNAVIRLCELTAGSPLALRLAALWLKLLPLEQIVREIERSLDLLATEAPEWPQRQRSMRAIFNYTYGLLSPPEQTLFRTLSVFRGGFSEDAAQQVVGASPFLLAALLDRGLLHLRMTVDGARYEMHELMRQFAVEQLSAAEEAERARRTHSAFYADLVQAQHESIQNRHYKSAVRIISSELDNIRAAWQWPLAAIADRREIPFALDALGQFVPTLAAYFSFRALWQSGTELLQAAATQLDEFLAWLDDAALADAREIAQSARFVMAQLRVRLAWFQVDLSDFAAVDRLATLALPVLREAEQAAETALLLAIWGRANLRRGIMNEAIEQLQESIDLFQQTGDKHGEAYALRSLAMVYSAEGDYSEARRVNRAALAAYEAIGYAPGVAQVLSNTGSTYGRDGDQKRALEYYQQALAVAETEEARQLIMMNTGNIGASQGRLGNHQMSLSYIQRSLRMAREIGNQRWVAANLQSLAEVHLTLHNLDDADRAATEGIALASGIDSRPDLLGCTSMLAHVWARRGRIGEALRILLFVEQHPATMARDKRFNEPLLNELRAELPPEIVDEAAQWANGQSLDELLAWIQRVQAGD